MFGKKFKHLHSQKISPTTKISIPLIWEPICNGGRKITVYNTQRGCDVMVYLTRNEGMMTFTDEVARGNGNGNFVTMELYWESNNIKLLNTFEPGDRVWAVQSASGIVSDPSNEITVRVGNGAPSYEPLKWKYNVTKNNCYNYACNIYSSGKLKTALALPGYGHSTPNGRPNPVDGVKRDGLQEISLTDWYKQKDEKYRCCHLVALVTSVEGVYHFYRLDNDDYWSHKDAWSVATNLDASGNKIQNLQNADRDYSEINGLNYENIKGYFVVDKNKVKIKNTGGW